MENKIWREEYKGQKFYWGIQPDEELKKAIKYATVGVALDIGAGEGRNSIFLAKNGFMVEAIDQVETGLEKCRKLASKYKLPIKTKTIDIRKFPFKEDKYSLILSIAALDFLNFSEIRIIISKIKKALKIGGIFYLVVLSTKDPLMEACRNRGFKEIEANTLFIPKFKACRHFFTKKELSFLFKDFKIIRIYKKKIRESHHIKPHYHHLIINIIKKE